MKHPVTVGQLSMDYFPPTLKVAPLAAMKDGGIPFLEIDRLSAPLDLPSLLRLKFVPTALQLDRWKLTVSRKPQGGWDLADWLSGLSVSTGSAPGPLRRILWKEGEVRWVDVYGSAREDLVMGSVAGTWDADGGGSVQANGAFPGIGSPATFTFAAKGRFLSDPQWSGDLQLANQGDNCAFHIDRKSGSWDADGAAMRWPLANALSFFRFFSRAVSQKVSSADPLMLDHWKLRAAGSAGRMVIEHNAGISGGLSEAKASVTSGPGGVAIRVDGAIKEIPAGAVWGLLGEDIPLSGAVTSVLKDFQLAFSSGGLTAVKGEGVCELKDGRYRMAAASVQKLAKAKTMPYLKRKFPAMDSQGIPVAKAGARWQVTDGVIAVQDGFLVSADLKAGWVGRLDSAKQGVDATLRVEFHEQDAKLLRLIPAYYRTQPVFARLQGTWQEWSLRSLRPGKIPAAVQSKLRKAIKQK